MKPVQITDLKMNSVYLEYENRTRHKGIRIIKCVTLPPNKLFKYNTCSGVFIYSVNGGGGRWDIEPYKLTEYYFFADRPVLIEPDEYEVFELTDEEFNGILALQL